MTGGGVLVAPPILLVVICLKLSEAVYRWSREGALRAFFKKAMDYNNPNIRYHDAGSLEFSIGPLGFEMNEYSNNMFGISVALDGSNQVTLVTAKNVRFSDKDKTIDLYRRLMFFILYGQDLFNRKTTEVDIINLRSCCQLVRAYVLVDSNWKKPESIFSRFCSVGGSATTS